MIIDGKKISEEVLYLASEKIKKDNIDACLAIIMVGENDASKVYVGSKEKSCKRVGIRCNVYKLSSEVSEEEVINLIEKLNSDNTVHGIILQSPLPKGLDFNKCVSYINDLKDVDGLSKDSIYNNYMNIEGMLPCTVSGILKLFVYHSIDLTGKNVCIIGRSNLVGKPLYLAMQNKGATVSLCHSKTKFLGDYTENCDILIVACGVPNLIKDYMVKDGVIVIDVGINRVDGKLCGDVDFDSVSSKASYITPVPGGVGPMTVACVIENTLLCYERIGKNG